MILLLLSFFSITSSPASSHMNSFFASSNHTSSVFDSRLMITLIFSMNEHFLLEFVCIYQLCLFENSSKVMIRLSLTSFTPLFYVFQDCWVTHYLKCVINRFYLFIQFSEGSAASRNATKSGSLSILSSAPWYLEYSAFASSTRAGQRSG